VFAAAFVLRFPYLNMNQHRSPLPVLPGTTKNQRMQDIICRAVETKQELREGFALRKKVFVEEQGLFKRTDRDRNDKKSVHIIAIYKGMIVGTVRVYQQSAGIWYGSRLAVLKNYRGRAGRALIQEAVDFVKEKGAEHFRAAIQLQNVSLFKRLGWFPIGPAITYRGHPHQLMEAQLK
jgi:putative N-acetyltransferase (TIGR04045 family)